MVLFEQQVRRIVALHIMTVNILSSWKMEEYCTKTR